MFPFEALRELPTTMSVQRVLVTAALAVVYFAASVQASALTTAIAANEKLCFYTDVDKAGEKIGVRPPVFALFFVRPCSLFPSSTSQSSRAAAST